MVDGTLPLRWNSGDGGVVVEVVVGVFLPPNQLAVVPLHHDEPAEGASDGGGGGGPAGHMAALYLLCLAGQAYLTSGAGVVLEGLREVDHAGDVPRLAVGAWDWLQ